MTKLAALLEDRGIRKAVVIDDVYDEAPRPNELDEGDWTKFFDDLGAAGSAFLSELYAAYEDTQPDDLRASQAFVSVLWANRARLPAPAGEHLFHDYENTKATERTALDALVAALETFGLTCTPMGRDLNEDAREADLIFVDLFLGFQQTEGDMERAVRRVSELVRNRADSPPLVVLMSRSKRLWKKRDEFRDNAGLLGSTFRVVSKADLAKDGRLETLLTRLANHYEDAKRVAAFLDAWDQGLERARGNFIRILRRLDLPDLAQIRAFLLDCEGQRLGEYLLDVADRVLQHEIEAETETVAAAQELNKIELGTYPAPHLAGSPDLQDLVHRMTFQHVERLKLSFDGETPTVQYGDVLACKDKDSGALTNDVLLVATPACDLARGGMEHVLVLPGTLIPLAAEDWSDGATIAKTPIFESEDGSRHWIKWCLKRRQTIPLATICEGLQNGPTYNRLGRLREIYTAEIQQRMLADMGRIGQPAKPPGTFPVSILLYAVSPDARVVSVSVDGLDAAVCFVGGDARRNRVDHLVLGEAACDALKGAVQGYPADNVHAAAGPSLAALKADIDFFERFEKGRIGIPQKERQWREEKGAGNLVYLHILRNAGVVEGDAARGNHRNAPFVMKVSDILPTQED